MNGIFPYPFDLTGMEEAPLTRGAMTSADFNCGTVDSCFSFLPYRVCQVGESHAHADDFVADAPGSAASGRYEAHPVESNAADCIAVEGKDTHAENVEFVDVTGV